MNLCVRCISLGIENAVHEYYTRLGLSPWTDFALHRRDDNQRANLPCLEIDRQTGRTTHGLLEAIAICEMRGFRELGVSSKAVMFTAMTLLSGLGLSDTIRLSARFRPQYKYVDHYHE